MKRCPFCDGRMVERVSTESANTKMIELCDIVPVYDPGRGHRDKDGNILVRLPKTSAGSFMRGFKVTRRVCDSCGFVAHFDEED